MTDVLTREQRHRNMSAIRGAHTKPEMVVRSLVHRLGYRFRLHRRDLPGKPDLVFAGRRKVVFVHGCFWHMHDCKYGSVKPATNAEFWQNKRISNVERDARHLKALRKDGWRVLVVWECETREPEQLQKRLDKFLSQ
ncbi:MAG TPA: DNA mismatch endonuclease Vsr [Blastocatellia bacterium]|nr:DNA mismatch endonuclease Vsr [Blastocatellia bacterium]